MSTMSELLFNKYTELYNKKYKKNVNFGGSISGYKISDDMYYINLDLIVRNYNKEMIYNYSKAFSINKQTDKSIFMNNYELIDINSDLDKIVSIE